MGKLGKNARKFAKKNLQSVHKMQRKKKSMIRKKPSSGHERGVAKDQVGDTTKLSNGRLTEGEYIEEISLDAILLEDDSDVVGDASDSDGFLSEDSSCTHIFENESESHLEGNKGQSALWMQNRKIQLELAKQKKKLDRLKEKDQDFSKFLESYKGLRAFRNEEIYSDDDETNTDAMQSVNEDSSKLSKGKLYTISLINSWYQLVTQQQSVSALSCLLNCYRAACHFGTESAGDDRKFQNSETFCNILSLTLRETDAIFRGLLGISCSSCRKETILDLHNNLKWKTLKPLCKSYLRSTLFLLNQVTDSEISVFSLTRLRASIIFFAAFPTLLQRLIKIAVHLWATGEGALSECSFLIIRDVATTFNSDCFDACLNKSYQAFIVRCKFVEPVFLKHILFLRNSLVELCSLDVQKSSGKALLSIEQLAKIFQQGLRTKKAAVEKICNWQYNCCVDLWVMFLSENIREHDLQPLLFTMIRVINGVAYLFPGPRYLPLRLKCIQWLNQLSSSSRIFIPVTSLVLDAMDYKIGKEGGKSGKGFNLSSSIKLPKNVLKSRNFKEECILSAVELLSAHFSQWSYHISFPELATIPLICLRKFHETTTVESYRRLLKRLIDQVEQNIEFVRKKRDEVAFSPNDKQSAESFLQLEKSKGNASFTQYYKSVMEKAASRNLAVMENISSLEQKRTKKRKERVIKQVDVNGNGETDSEEKKGNGNERKKRRT